MLKDEELSQKTNIHRKKSPFTWLTLMYYLETGLMFILFFIFSILAIIEIKNPYQNFIDYAMIREMFSLSFEESDGLDIKNDILARIDTILYEGDYSSYFKQASMTRFSFYQANNKTCNKEYTDFSGETKCYNPYYKNNKNNTAYNLGYDKEEEYTGDYFVYSNSSTDKNYYYVNGETAKENLDDFLFDVFRGFDMQNYEVDSSRIDGDLGIYDGENCVDLFVTLNLINYDTIQLILSMAQSFYLDFSKQNQKAVLVDFTLYSLSSKTYFYIYFLYENSVSAGSTKPVISIIPFYPDLKQTDNGKAIYVLDFIKLIIIIILFLIRIKEIYNEIVFNNELEKHHKLAKSNTSIVFFADLLLDLALFIIYIITFSLKINNLYSKAAGREIAVQSTMINLVLMNITILQLHMKELLC